MKNLIKKLILSLILTPFCLFAQTSVFKYEKTNSFFPNSSKLKQENIEWGYLNVPENWDNPKSKNIKIAVAILKCTTKNITLNPILYIEGGPGAGGIDGIWTWLQHPLRKNNDIILVDVRGTGFSFPKFCPELGNKFLEILSKNQTSSQDEEQKVIAAMACKQDLINRNIDLNAYNSKYIAKDLNALKIALKYKDWNVYGISYGTYTAQVYANDFPQDIKSLILDSSIPDISSEYYNNSTSKYMNSLKKVFEECKNNTQSNEQYPNLEKKYYAIINKLSKKPITVSVDKKVIPSGFFTYNVEDFKICIQQSLYQKRLIEVIPLLITQFYNEDKATLRSLVASFSGALNLDYGAFYCVTCNEAFPYNSIIEFNKDANQFKELKGGLSFYKSDFLVCDKWNLNNNNNGSENDLSNLSNITKPVLVFSGEFDPITPVLNGKITVKKFKNSFLVNAPISGHGASISKLGAKIVDEFVKNPTQRPNTKDLEFDNKVHFVKDVNINGGVSSFANSLNEFNLLFFAPLCIAILILIISIFNFGYVLIKNKKDSIQNKLIKILIILTSFIAVITIVGFVLAIDKTNEENFYILAFGLENKFDYLFILQWVFIVMTFVSFIYFLLKIKIISNRTIISTILFSLILISVYFQYWGFLF